VIKIITVPAKLTEKIIFEAEEIIKEGWYANKSEMIRDALRDLIRKMKSERLESAIKEDVMWGLHGKN
jgi:Arc/MetJ-type ribon-helix-helix transcriptional regulator